MKKNPRRILFLAGLATISSGCGRKPSTPSTGTDRPPAANVSADPWTLVSRSPFHNYGGYLGNGYIGMRFGASGTTDSPNGMAPSDEPGFRSRPLLCTAAGLYSREQLVAAPNWGHLSFGDETSLVSPESGSVAGYSQQLDLRRGELTTSYRAPNAHPAFAVELTTRLHRDEPHLATFDARVIPEGEGRIRIHVPALSADPAAFTTLKSTESGSSGELLAALEGAEAPANGFLAIGQRIEARDVNDRPLPLHPGARAGDFLLSVRANHPVFVTKWVYVDAEPRNPPNVMRAVGAAMDGLQRRGLPTLAASHRSAWSRLWDSDIEIDGDIEAQQAVRSSLFSLLCSAREGSPWSIPPMGLSGLQWGGHIFWDADTWMFPVLGLLHPKLAESIVDYRYRTLDGARWNARQRGYRGADFATESAVTGREMAPAEFPFERHNTADVAIAQWRQFLLDGDRKRLAEKAFPILRETAAYWQSRVIFNPARDRYEIRHVISPDETAHFVDNDAYTNAAARLNLQFAVEAGRLLGRPTPPEWTTITNKLWLPFDHAARRYIEHEGKEVGRIKAKQADAQLLFFPLDLPAPVDVVANTLSYYAAHTSPLGPAMTSSVHCAIAARLAARAKAGSNHWLARSLGYFRDSYRPFVRPPFNDFSEKRSTDNTTFLTGCAGVVMGPLYGFGGIRYDEAGIRADPVLPPGWTRLRIIGIHYRGRIYDLDAENGGSGRLEPRRGG